MKFEDILYQEVFLIFNTWAVSGAPWTKPFNLEISTGIWAIAHVFFNGYPRHDKWQYLVSTVKLGAFADY